MSTVRRWLARWLGAFGLARRDLDIREELEAHLALQTEENLRRGLSTEQARRAALLQSGGLDAALESVRDQRGLPFLDRLRQDVRFGGRMLRRSPGFALAAVLSLGLGMGANVAVFSLTDAVFLKSLPVPRPAELVAFEWAGPVRTHGYDGSMRRGQRPGEVIGTSFPLPLLEQMQATSPSLSGMFAFAPLEQVHVVADGTAGIASGQLVTGDYHLTLGVRAFLGRTLLPGDDQPDAAPVAVLEHGYWRRVFGGDSSVVGRRVRINGAVMTIAGVTAPGFVGTLEVGDVADVTMPMSAVLQLRPGSTDLTNLDFWWVQIMARRRPDSALMQVQAELGPVFRGAIEGVAAGTVRLQLTAGGRGPGDERRDYRLPLLLLSATAAVILAVACANLANLLLARAAARQRELTIRLALGAHRARLVQQLLVESFLLVLAAQALALLFAQASTGLLRSLRPSSAALDLGLNLRVLVFATAVSALAVCLFALVPVLRATRVDPAHGLKQGGRGVHGRVRSPFSRGLVVAQIALSLVLLAGATLFQRTLHNLNTVNVGFDTDALLLFRIDPRLSGYDAARIPTLYRELHTRIEAIPGVLAVTFSRHPLLTGGRRSNSVEIDGRATASVLIHPVGTAFFETMRLPVLRGRAFTRQDETGPPVAIVNESFVRTYFGAQQPLGRRIEYSDYELEIVGVSADARSHSVRQGDEPALYIPFQRYERGQASFAVRTAGDPRAFTGAVRAAVNGIDPLLFPFQLQTQRAAIDATLGEERMFARLATALSALALLLVCVGVYGVLSYTATRRTGEIGVRRALGARDGSLFWLVARSTVWLVGMGTMVGLFAALQAARLVAGVLYGLAPTDALSLALAAGLLLLVAAGAAVLPITRALRVSPLAALRHE